MGRRHYLGLGCAQAGASMRDDDTIIDPPNPRVILIAGGYTGIVCPGECGCTLDDLMPCGVSGFDRDGNTGIPKGCQPGYVHNDPRGGSHWVVSTKKKTPTVEAFDMWVHLS